MVFLTKDEWIRVENSLLSKNPNQIRKYKSIFNIMKYINSNLRFSNQIVLSIAMLYYHKINIAYNSSILSSCIEENIFYLSAALFLSGKYSNYLFSVHSLLPIIKNIIKKKNLPINTNADYLKERIFDCEFEILVALNFDLNVDLPYKFISKLSKFFEGRIKFAVDKIVKLCWYYVNDTFILPLGIFFKPDVIAISCAVIVCSSHDVGIEVKELVKLSDCNVDEEEVVQCMRVIKVIYENGGDGEKERK